MKKIALFLSIAYLCAALCVFLSGCNMSTDEPSHVHSYEGDWICQDTHHQRECANEDCTDPSEGGNEARIKNRWHG